MSDVVPAESLPLRYVLRGKEEVNEPICHDLYCGLGGWAEGFMANGFHCIGYDIVKHDYGTGTYPGELIIQDILEMHGSRCKEASVIVASPPCQEPSYRAMPWKRAKALNAAGPPYKFIALFEACFRIQREASEAAGHYIPLIVENVVGAQRWVGRAKWHFGSYYLWGDVPALMPITMEGLKVASESGRRTVPGNGVRFTSQDCGIEGETKLGGSWFHGYRKGQGPRNHGSNSRARARASAEIAKIPFPLADWIAKTFLPCEVAQCRA